MAEKRMFHTAVVEADAFLDLPLSTQVLYFHLGMQADDDGERWERRRGRIQRPERVAAVDKIEERRKPEDFIGYRNRNSPHPTPLNNVSLRTSPQTGVAISRYNP